ncbi:hypothetical protein [Peribacillus frigoritolerans]|uniref:hypothetical protein n=1 Tax=Peribacillus frigoritolerans TaxID=450367 RepID=UPI001070E0DD|nr:hypothetical protein [Peribacillus frigoritolerans]TFH63500.1 hypothetical protein E4J71_07055 [Peribacillus frigoritolerans]
MYKNKGIITEEEQILISRYPDEIQEQIIDELLKNKECSFSSNSYDSWIEHMEEGLKVKFLEKVILMGEPNISRLARLWAEYIEGRKIKPLIWELEHDGRLEEFKKYPKGTRIKANGEVIMGK